MLLSLALFTVGPVSLTGAALWVLLRSWRKRQEALEAARVKVRHNAR